MRQITQEVFINQEDTVPFLTFPKIEQAGPFLAAFSTRKGGVSRGIYRSMNLNYKQGDNPEDVKENFRRIADSMGVPVEDMVYSAQTHTANVRIMTEGDKGKGVMQPRDYEDVDGMITDRPGLILVGSFADCVPLFFADPVHKAVGLSHAGWRGTVSKIGKVTVEMMREHYGSRPEDLICVIGPSICVDCYEVSQDVAEAFQQAFSKTQTADILTEKGNGKYQLDLWRANAHVLKDSGILPEHIAIAGLCTRCNSDLLWSHRATAGKRGGLCGFISVME